MKRDNSNFKLVGGLLAGMIIGGATVVGANQAIQALQNTEIKVSLNGQIQEFKDETTGETQYPITYHDRTYLPLRNVAKLAGLNVDYDEKTNTALLSSTSNISKSFIERIEPYTSFIDNTAFNYVSENTDYLGFIDSEHYVSDSSLKKENDSYILSLTVSAPLIFKDSEVQDMIKRLESNNTAELSGYTFYKTVDLLKSSNKLSEVYINLIDNYESKEMLATDNQGNLYYLFAKSNEGLEYKIASLNVAGASGFVIMNPIKTIDVVLYGSDKIIIESTEAGSKEITVEDYYNKAINNEIEKAAEIEGYLYSLTNLGDCQDTYACYCDSVWFNGNSIIINYKNGGV